MGTRWTRLSPLGVALLAVTVAALFVTARWQVAAERDLSRFVVAGDEYVQARPGLHVEQGRGYDGQFSYRLALDPAELERRAHGIVIDSPLRLQRIAYPAVVHVVALGRAAWVPWALVLVNLLGVGLLGLLGAVVARRAGRAPVAGLMVPGWFGTWITLGRDLTEIVTAVLLLAGIAGWQSRRRGLATLALSAAVLSREAVLPVLAVFTVVQLARERRGLRLRTAGLVTLPLVSFVGWQAVCWASTGHVPLLTSHGKNVVPPLTDLVPAAAGWLRGALALERLDLILTGQLLALVVLVAAGAVALRTSQVLPGVKAAWGVALLLVASLSANVWVGPADFRTATELHVLTAVVLLTSKVSLLVPGVVLAVTSVMTALFRVTSI
jgi:hypothetical protein